MEVIKKVESRGDFWNWGIEKYPRLFKPDHSAVKARWKVEDLYVPDIAKLALIQEWVETKSIELETHYEPKNDGYYWYLRSDEITRGYDFSDEYESRNEALAKGIEEALKLI